MRLGECHEESATCLVFLAVDEAAMFLRDDADTTEYWRGLRAMARVVNALLLRGRGAAARRNNEATIIDIGGAIEMVRWLDIDPNDPFSSDGLSAKDLGLAYKTNDRVLYLEALALTKAGSPRPHHDATTADNICRELGIDHLSTPIVLSLSEKQLFDGEIDERGCASADGADGPITILRDLQDPQVYFDSLSDRTVQWSRACPHRFGG